MSETIDEESAVVEATEPSPLPSGEDEEAAVAGSAPEAEATNLGVTVDGGEAVIEVTETATEAAENESADKSPEEEVAAGETEDASATVDADGAGSEDGEDGGASGADAAPSVEDGTASSETAPADGENGPANEGEATKDTKAEVAEGEAVEGEVAEEAGADVPALELPEDGDAGGTPKEDNGQTATETEEGADEQASGGDTPKDANEMEELQLADDPEAGSGDEHERQQRELDQVDEELGNIEVEEVIKVDRETLVTEYIDVFSEYEKHASRNIQLQNRIGEYLRKKKIDDRDRGQQGAMTDEDKDTRYAKLMATLEDVNQEATEQEEHYQGVLEKLRAIVELRITAVKEMYDIYTENRKEPMANAVYSTTGKPIKETDIHQLMDQEMQKEMEVIKIRLESIRQRIHLEKKEAILQQHETLPDGSKLNVIDFEQLKVENQSLADTVEGRSQDVRKLQTKLSRTVQLLSHIREKVSHAKLESEVAAADLATLDTLVAEKRDELSKVKKLRDKLRAENQRLKEEGGLLGHNMLLKDFAFKQDKLADLKGQIASVQTQHQYHHATLEELRRAIHHHEVTLAQVYASGRGPVQHQHKQTMLRSAKW